MAPAALVLAAHGSRHRPDANVKVEEAVLWLRRQGPFDEVTAAYHQGRPAFSQVLDGLRSLDVTVVPFMTSRGFFCDHVLPRELAKNRSYHQLKIRVTPPVGLHPALPELVTSRLEKQLRERRCEPRQTAVAVVGHGTLRHPRSRQATQSLAEKLCSRGLFAQVKAFFLDEPPQVEEIPGSFQGRPTVVVPFLMGGGAHALEDLPRRLGTGAELIEEGSSPRLYVDRPVGDDPALPALVAQLALA